MEGCLNKNIIWDNIYVVKNVLGILLVSKYLFFFVIEYVMFLFYSFVNLLRYSYEFLWV